MLNDRGDKICDHCLLPVSSPGESLCEVCSDSYEEVLPDGQTVGDLLARDKGKKYHWGLK